MTVTTPTQGKVCNPNAKTLNGERVGEIFHLFSTT